MGEAEAGRKRCTYKRPGAHRPEAWLPLDSFGTNRSSTDGLNYWCKACVRANSAERSAKIRAEAARDASDRSEAERSEAPADETVAPEPAVPPNIAPTLAKWQEDRALVPVEQNGQDEALSRYEGDLVSAIAECRNRRADALELDDTDGTERYDAAIEKLVRELVR